jgi:hypothetical protein
MITEIPNSIAMMIARSFGEKNIKRDMSMSSAPSPILSHQVTAHCVSCLASRIRKTPLISVQTPIIIV